MPFFRKLANNIWHEILLNCMKINELWNTVCCFKFWNHAVVINTLIVYKTDYKSSWKNHSKTFVSFQNLFKFVRLDKNFAAFWNYKRCMKLCRSCWTFLKLSEIFMKVSGKNSLKCLQMMFKTGPISKPCGGFFRKTEKHLITG